MSRIRVAGPCAGVLLVLGLAACGTPSEYRSPAEIPEGPGVFTGENGAVRFSTEGDESAQTPARDSECGCPEAGELEAYREFLRWKADAVGTPEYREFQDWREWRRERED